MKIWSCLEGSAVLEAAVTVYDYIPNGSLFWYLDLKEGDSHVLIWSTRVSIINGIAKGTLLATVVVHSIAKQIKNLRFFFYLNRCRVFAWVQGEQAVYGSSKHFW